ncbi:hypothetical protein [Thermoactinomyces sp. DSM 45892]|uniref:hypothetical protein n=1 Tax=Thermoactinomyces sp. DSM 45892 TaxID=1882753 RepID=UPI000897490B|nr:hypothetical protein [Thermoactinomyces sp. DSM 45892]SDZ01023.1 hypothetical protein SAMN05444416_111113 [Thermoactinomyces sp. DSM 45892]
MAFIDFDQFLKEQNHETIKIQVGGETYEIPAAPRADLMLKIIAVEQQKGMSGELSTQETVDMLKGVFSPEVLEEISCKLTFEQLTQLLRLVIEEQSKGMTDGAENKDMGKQKEGEVKTFYTSPSNNGIS